MLNLIKIIFRVILSLIFGGIVFWIKRKEEKLPPEIYPLFSFSGTLLALFSLKIFLNLYSKIDLSILPVSLILGIFLIGQSLIKKEEAKETIIDLGILWLTSLTGLIIGFGFYWLAIFSGLFILSFSYLFKFLK